jgi:NADH:ubiquinone oxidoreductase subunit F (NADH-binding)
MRDRDEGRVCPAQLAGDETMLGRPANVSLERADVVKLRRQVPGTWAAVDWLAGESAGQCGPCVHGLRALADELTDLAAGRSTRQSAARLTRSTTMIDGRGGCRFPDGVTRLVRSALRVFADDIEHHLLHGPCWRTASRPVLPAPLTDGTWR